jgi:hypothetical protein
MKMKKFIEFNEHKYYDEWDIPEYKNDDIEDDDNNKETEEEFKKELKKTKVHLRYTTTFKKILKKLNVIDNGRKNKIGIADKFLTDFKKLETNISFFDVVDDDNVKLSYLPKNRILGFRRVINPKSKKYKLLDDKDNTVYKSTMRQKLRLGRIINKLWNNEFTAEQIENFVNDYKAEHDMLHGNINIKLVSGKDIAYWYDYHKYAPGGTLNKSCMRAVGKNRLALYVDNPEKIKLAIFTKGEKLEARALVWETNQGVYMDRIYYTVDHLANSYVAYADKMGWMCYNKKNQIKKQLVVNLEHGDKKYYANHPYLDSFSLSRDGKRLVCC